LSLFKAICAEDFTFHCEKNKGKGNNILALEIVNLLKMSVCKVSVTNLLVITDLPEKKNNNLGLVFM